MTNEKILTKAIEKATANGWYFGQTRSTKKFTSVINDAGDLSIEFYIDVDLGQHEEWDVEKLIFSHDFAKAVWGENRFSSDPEEVGIAYGMLTAPWQYHLQQMAIADDPIAYLGENI